MRKVEVLAPAGSLDICKAVIRAGADAVYLGGDMFGARAYAGNLNRDELLEAIDFAHIRGAKIYLTVNTLLKENEIRHQLADYLKPYYEAGLDAVIVQDLGVFNVIKNEFPQLPIHASTQMTITGSFGAKIARDMGASRIVTARELTIDEIRKIHESVDIEIESFVHGALCYCYSGQCLLSSMNGNRSGNRGRCAQSCRLAYDVYDGARKVNSDSESFPLSPKDMCALKLLPDIIDAGVYSLKIEGRMKNVTYAAGVTSIYRKYVDMYLEKGKKGYAVDDRDYEELLDIYNRGGFNTGYYSEKKGRAMMSVERPNHMGTLALEVKENIRGRVTFEALREINPQDVFEIDSDNSFSSGGSYRKGDKFVVNLPSRYPLKKGRKLYRTRNNRVTTKVIEHFVDDLKNGNQPLDMTMSVSVGKPLTLRLKALGFETEVCGEVVQEAKNSPADADSVRQKLCKLGNTPFVVGEVHVDIDGDAFLPVSWINDIRRQGTDKLSDVILGSHKRVYKSSEADEDKVSNAALKNANVLRKSYLVSDENQLVSLADMLDELEISVLYVERESLTERGVMVLKNIMEKGVCVVAALPHIVTQTDISQLKNLILKFVDLGIDTFLVRNLEEIGALAEFAQGACVVTDSNVYVWNSFAYKMLRNITESCGLRLLRVTYPYELTDREICRIATDCETELIVNSDIPVMVSKQCVRKTYGLCDHGCGSISVRDRRRQADYIISSKCDYCYSVMYGTERLSVDIDGETAQKIAPDFVRYEYSMKNEIFAGNVGKLEEGFKAHLITGVE